MLSAIEITKHGYSMYSKDRHLVFMNFLLNGQLLLQLHLTFLFLAHQLLY